MMNFGQKAFLQLRALIFSKTAKNTFVVFFGNAAAAVLTMFSIVIVSRALGPSNFGIFSTATAVMATIAGFTDFGLGSALVRFVNLHKEKSHEKARLYLNVVFKAELVIGLFILIIGLVFVENWAQLLSAGDHREMVFPLRLAILGGFGLSMSAFVTAGLQAYEKFWHLSLFPMGISLIRLFSFLVLFLLGGLTLISTLWVHALVPVLGFFVGILFVGKLSLGMSRFDEQKRAFWEVFHFSKWLTLSFFLNSISGRLDILFLSKIKGSSQVGFYSAAFTLTLIFPIIIGALSAVLIPKVSRFTQKSEVISYIKKGIPLALGLTASIIPLFFLAPILVNFIFGNRYSNSIPVFEILLITYGLNFLLIPFSVLLIAFNKTKISTLASVAQIVILFTSLLILTPGFGMEGTAWSRVLATIASFLIHITFLYLYVKRLKPNGNIMDQLERVS